MTLAAKPFRLFRRRKLLIALLCVALASGAWWATAMSADTPTEQFRTQAIDQGPISQVVTANGHLQPVGLVTVGTVLSGTVTERLVDFNDKVVKGQVLLRLDAAAFEARLRQSRAGLASAEAQLVFAHGTLERHEALHDQGFIAAPQRDQSRREVAQAQAQLDIARAQLDAAATDLANTVVRAPVDGVVLKRSVDVGQTVAASFQTPELFLIARSLDEMAIHANVSEADVGLIREDQPVRFSVDAHPHMEFEGRVAQFRLHAANAHGVVSYTVVVNVPNAQGLLKPGMTAQTRIVVASRQAALRLPTAALRFRPEEADLLPKGAKAASSAPTGALMTKSASAHGSQDDGALAGLRQGARVYKVYTVGADQVLKAHEVTVGIANTRFTELLPGSTLNAGDALVTRPVKLLAVDHAS